MNTKTIILIGVILLVVIIIVVIVMKKSSAPASNEARETTSQAVAVGNATGATAPNCTPYTQAQYDRAVKNCRNKCQPKLIIPFVGVGAYSKCTNACKQALPYVQEC